MQLANQHYYPVPAHEIKSDYLKTRRQVLEDLVAEGAPSKVINALKKQIRELEKELYGEPTEIKKEAATK